MNRFSIFFLRVLPLFLLALIGSPMSLSAAEKSPGKNALYSKKKKVPAGATDKEIKLGDKTAADLEKNPKVKIIDPKKSEESKALYEKLNKIAQTLGKNSGRPKIEYKVKVIDDDDVNAFTLPNGNIYFYTGLLEILGSDDEIAAVMAHEIGHNAEMHALRGSAKSSRASLIGMAAILAALAGGGQGGTDVALFSQYLLTGIISGYSIDFEKEADASAVDTMIKSGYNPSALATVMQRFEVEEKRRPKTEPGIFRTHPPSLERAEAVKKQILAEGLPFNPRAVSGGANAEVIESEESIQVRFHQITLMEFSGSTSESKTRAEQAASALNSLLKDNVQLHEIQIRDDGPKVLLLARGVEIAQARPADAALQNLTPLECAQKWRDNLRLIFWRETIQGAM